MALIRLLGPQLRRPRGLLGRLTGRAMALVNRPINRWTVGLLDLRPGDRVLEVGFGGGVAIGLISDRVPKGSVAGVDYSETMVRQARLRNASAVRDGRVDLRRGDVASLPFEDGSFDKACSIQSIYFWPEPVAGLKELRRVLKPGGLLAISVFPKQHVEFWSFALAGYYNFYSDDELIEMLTEAGFRRTRLEHRWLRPRAVCALAVK